MYGWRPSSPEPRRDVDVQVRGARRAGAPTSARSSAAQPTWAPTNVVAGWRATSRPNAASSSSNGGNPGASGSSAGRVGQKCQSGLAWSSSQRSFVASSGSKNAIGSAMWMTTGRSSSAAVAQSGSSRGSSTATRRPSGSRARSPSSFQTLSPRAPRAAESRSRLASVSPNAGSVGPARRSRARRTRRPGSGYAALPPIDLGRQAVALAAVEVHEPSRRPAASSVAISSAGGAASPSRRRTATRGGCGRRRPGTAAGGPRATATRSDDARPEVGERRSSVGHPGSRMTTWPRWRGASGSRPRVRATRERQGVAGVEEQRQARGRVQPAADRG